MFPIAALYASVEGLSSTKVEEAHPRHTQSTASAVIWLLDISSSLHFAPSTTAYAFLARDCLANSRQLPPKDPQKSRHQCYARERLSPSRHRARRPPASNESDWWRQ